MKIKIFRSHDTTIVENQVNEFISSNRIRVEDIKFSESVVSGQFLLTACVIYEERADVRTTS